MRLTAALCTIALLASATPAATSTTPEAGAESAARAWLRLVDAGNYAANWRTVCSLFRQKTARFRLLLQVGGLTNAWTPVRARSFHHMYPAAQAQR
jgi:hypothetical protein